MNTRELFDRCAASSHHASALFTGLQVMVELNTPIPTPNLTVLRNLLTESLAGVMKLESLALGNDEPKKG